MPTTPFLCLISNILRDQWEANCNGLADHPAVPSAGGNNVLVLALFVACFGLYVAGVVKFGEQKPGCVCVFVMRPLASARLIIPLSGGSNQWLLFYYHHNRLLIQVWV